LFLCIVLWRLVIKNRHFTVSFAKTSFLVNIVVASSLCLNVLMNRTTKNQQGFAHILILVAVVALIGGIAFLVYTRNVSNNSDDHAKSANNVAKSTSDHQKPDVPTIKNLPINIAKYDPTTGMAGDMKFIKWDTKSGGLDAIFSEYGRKAAANNGAGAGRMSPQPTFIAPQGTKVHSIVDGTVYDVPKLYSGDYSIMVQGKDQSVIFETEHVINPLVKKGDAVKAGQVIAEVSDYDSHNLNGLGLVEMGVLLPGNPPKHACTFDYLDDSVKDDITSKLTQLMNDWESYMNDKNIYDQASMPIPGCTTRDKVDG